MWLSRVLLKVTQKTGFLKKKNLINMGMLGNFKNNTKTINKQTNKQTKTAFTR